MMVDEEWRVIPSHPDFSASSLGRIRRDIGGRRGSRVDGLCKQYADKNGYLKVGVSVDAAWSNQSVHRLVATAFNGPCPNGLQCSHLNGDKRDNSPGNLAWVTCKENISHKNIHGTMARGERQGLAKLNEQQILEIRAGKWPLRKTAKEYGVSKSLVSLIRRKEIWTHI